MIGIRTDLSLRESQDVWSLHLQMLLDSIDVRADTSNVSIVNAETVACGLASNRRKTVILSVVIHSKEEIVLEDPAQ